MKEKEKLYREGLQAIREHAQRRFSAVVGLDGFVDEVVYIVDRRIDEENYTRIQTIREYGERIIEAGGLSMNIEVVPISKKIGGNGPIYAWGLKQYGADVTYIGCIGKDRPVPTFQAFSEQIRCYCVADPGCTDAMEFMDGKIIRSKLESLNHLTWEDITACISVEKMIGLFEKADLLSFNNWTMIPHMSKIWRRLLDEVIPYLNVNRKTIFFDLADPRKRKREDICEALCLIREFHDKGMRTVLGLNKKEAMQIAGLIAGEERVKAELKELTGIVAEYMQIDAVVVHPVDRSACIVDGMYYEVEGPYCSSPVLTTGAGDAFNSGFLWGIMQNLTPDLCLLLGVMTSGYYVRKGKNATLNELRAFIESCTFSNQK